MIRSLLKPRVFSSPDINPIKCKYTKDFYISNSNSMEKSFYVFTLMMTLTMSASFGDFALPPESQSCVFKNTEIEIRFLVSGQKLVVWAKLNQLGFFGIGYKDVMA